MWGTSILILLVTLALAAGHTTIAAQRRGGDSNLAAVKNPVEASPESITAGRQLYLKNCRHCHGTKGLGDGPLAPTDVRPANLTDEKWDHGSTDGEIFAVIANGAGPDSQMKGAKPTLTDTQIWNIVNFIRSLGPSPAPR